MTVSAFIMPLIAVGVFGWGLYKKVDIFEAFTEGAAENLKTAAGLLPTLCFLMLGVGMLRASGGTEALCLALAPLCQSAGFPPECLPLALLRPVSGSGALSILEGILKEKGPDSFAGRVASVLMGSTETTFYTIAVYFGAAGIKKSRRALLAALAGDVTAFLLSALAVRIFFG